MKILLVEDDQFLSELYQDSLGAAGHSVVTSRHAQEAVLMLEEYGADLILLDIMLPGHNGLELINEMQSYDDWQAIPIVVISSINREEFGLSDLQWMDMGVVDYLYKPTTSLQDLNRLVEVFARA
jgi:DNA-binding response OmpR family regulator